MKLNAKQTIKIYWQHSKPYKKWLAGMVLGVVISTAGDTASPYLYKQFINILASYDYNQYNKLLILLVIILVVRSIRSYSYRFKDYLANFFQPRVMNDLVNTCFSYIHANSYSFFTNNFVGSLVNKVKKYERSFEVITDRVADDFLRTSLGIIFITIVLYTRHWLLGTSVLVWCVLYIVVIYFFSKYKLKYDMRKAELEHYITGQLADTITNNVNIKLFSNFASEKKKFEKTTDEHFRIRRYSWDLMTYLEIIQGTLMLALEILMMYIAIRYWKRGLLTVGDFTLIQLYLISIFDKLWMMGKHIRMVYEALADAGEMTEILTTPHSINDLPRAKKIFVPKGQVEFSQAGFSYKDGDAVLENFNVTIQPGQKIALIGPSGGGKSTVVKLLLRFFDLQKGKILIDGQDISRVTQNSLRDNLALVPQDPILFHRSLMDNIRYSKPSATDAEVIKAAKSAHAHEFIKSFPQGYDTYVGERGIKLSGGERQRVAIARAILKNAPILVLDEATSSLDSESESYIQDALKNLMKGKTVIVIAHRLSTVMQMDRIIVLENGKITEEGKHEELLKMREGTYQKLWEIQAGGFAAA